MPSSKRGYPHELKLELVAAREDPLTTPRHRQPRPFPQESPGWSRSSSRRSSRSSSPSTQSPPRPCAPPPPRSTASPLLTLCPQVADLKKKIEAEQGFPVDNQKIIFSGPHLLIFGSARRADPPLLPPAGKILPDDKTVADADFKPKDVREAIFTVTSAD